MPRYLGTTSIEPDNLGNRRYVFRFQPGDEDLDSVPFSAIVSQYVAVEEYDLYSPCTYCRLS